MSTWIKIDPEKLKQGMPHPRPPQDEGIRVSLELSPYDIPEAVRGHYDVGLHRFIIDFRYIGEESTITKTLDQYLQALVGKHSRRIYSLQIDIKALKTKNVELELKAIVRDGIRHLDEIYTKGFLPIRYEVTRSVIDSASEELLSKRDRARILETV